MFQIRRIFSRLSTKHKRQIVHFLHIGKTGGTAVIHALNEANYCIQSERQAARGERAVYKLNPADERNHLWICIHAHDEGLRVIPNGEKVFFFLRDPISRFVSAFYSRQRQGQPKYNSLWTHGEKIAFERFKTPNQLANAIYSEDPMEKSTAQQAMKSIRHIRNPYWEWFESEEYLRSRMADIFFIGFQEHLNEDFERLKSKLNLPAHLSLPTDEVNAFISPPNLDKNLDKDAIKNLQRWHKDDYRFITFCKNNFDRAIITSH